MKPHDTKCSETSSNIDDTLTYGHAIVHMLITVARTPPRKRRNPTSLNHAWSSNKQKAGGSCMQVRSRWTPAKAMWLHHSREKLFPLASSLPCPRPMGHWPHRTTNTSRKFAGGRLPSAVDSIDRESTADGSLIVAFSSHKTCQASQPMPLFHSVHAPPATGLVIGSLLTSCC